MCGIVGLIAKQTNGFTAKETGIFKNMLFLDVLRGQDSTGVFGVDKSNNVLIHKAAVHALDFIRTKEYSDFDNKLFRSGSFAVGHNRAATRGAVENKNAHPFWVDDKIILVQNGTYYGNHKHLKDVEVDTEAIAHVLAEEDDVEKALQKINSAYALVWYNTDNRKLHIIRNEQRPLFLARSDDGTIMFASEAATIFWAASREGVKIGEAPTMVPSSMLHTFEILPNGDHKEEVVKLDYHYRSKSYQGDVSEAWRRHLGQHDNGYVWPGVDDAGEDDPVGAPPWSKKWLVPATPGTTDTTVVSSADVKTTFSDYAIVKLTESHMSHGEAQKYYDIFDSMRIVKKQVMVELVDYIPANNRKDCCTFFVYGQLIDVKNHEGPQPLIYWLVSHEREEVVLKMCTEQVVFSGTISSINVKNFLDTKNERKSVIYSFLAEPQPVETLTDVVQ